MKMSHNQSSHESEGFVPDKVKKAEKRIEASPHDIEAWSILIRDAQMKPIDQCRTTYERLVSQFTNAGRYWKIYIEHELKSKNFERVEKLFQRCLIKVLNIDLWKLYISYIKETKGKLPSYREKMAQAYDFALDKMGMDIMSYTIWSDYVTFLKSVDAVGSYAENQRITAVRKVFQRGVVNPMINIEALWKDYGAYENSINPLIAKKMIEDRGREYMNSRRVSKEYEAITRGLNRNLPSTPPGNTPEEATQVELWKKYIQWEMSNPLRTEDQALITKRVMFAYEGCLLCLGYYPDVWIESCSYLEQSSKILTEKGDQNAGKMFADEASSLYERSISTTMMGNMLLYFSYADFEEGRMKYEKVHNIYKRCIAVQDIDPTLVYVQYMKFARRAEGIKSARLVFKLAREDTRSKYHVFIAAGLMEYYCSKILIIFHSNVCLGMMLCYTYPHLQIPKVKEKTVALKIFELGLKKFGHIIEYAVEYIDFMSHLNEDNNTRVLFERVLSSGQIPPEKSIEIWSRFLAFESEVGDLASILKVEKRRSQAIEKVQEFEGKDTALLLDRYKYRDIFPCNHVELKVLGYYDLVRHQVFQMPSSSVTKVVLEEEESMKRPEYPKPDTAQMIPFKPKVNASADAHVVPGGVFPVPNAAAALMTMMPPPECFQGPFVKMDKFLEHFMRLEIPDGPLIQENGFDGHLKMDPGTLLSLEYASGRKRRVVDDNSDEEDVDAGPLPPVNDIYRSRQQKRAK